MDLWRKSDEYSSLSFFQPANGNYQTSTPSLLLPRKLLKVCAKLTNGVRLGLGFVFERACGAECGKCRSKTAFFKQCRYFNFKPHWEVALRSTPKNQALGRVSSPVCRRLPLMTYFSKPSIRTRLTAFGPSSFTFLYHLFLLPLLRCHPVRPRTPEGTTSFTSLLWYSNTSSPGTPYLARHCIYPSGKAVYIPPIVSRHPSSGATLPPSSIAYRYLLYLSLTCTSRIPQNDGGKEKRASSGSKRESNTYRRIYISGSRRLPCLTL